jgi:hypothetical protein
MPVHLKRKGGVGVSTVSNRDRHLPRSKIPSAPSAGWSQMGRELGQHSRRRGPFATTAAALAWWGGPVTDHRRQPSARGFLGQSPWLVEPPVPLGSTPTRRCRSGMVTAPVPWRPCRRLTGRLDVARSGKRSMTSTSNTSPAALPPRAVLIASV